MSELKQMIRRVPVIGPTLTAVYVWAARRCFAGSAHYWDSRYARGGDSGSGSYGEFARFKAKVLNELVGSRGIASVIEFGCGDGNQLKLARYPRYVGVDVSPTAIEICRRMYGDDPTKSFCLTTEYRGQPADLALSLDVVYHLVEDEVYEYYMRTLFAAASRMVVIYASDTDEQEVPQLPHVRHRKFSRWIATNAPEWTLTETIDNALPYDPSRGSGTWANFYVFERRPR